MFVFGMLPILLNSKFVLQFTFQKYLWCIANTITRKMCFAILYSVLHVHWTPNTVTEQMCSAGSVLYLHLVCLQYSTMCFILIFGTLQSK